MLAGKAGIFCLSKSVSKLAESVRKGGKMGENGGIVREL